MTFQCNILGGCGVFQTSTRQFSKFNQDSLQNGIRFSETRINCRNFNFQILQLYTSLQTCRNVILLGSPGSGKTTVYKTLSSALNRLNNQAAQRMVKVRRQTVAQRRISNSARSPNTPVQESNDVLWPRVDLTVLFPKCLTCEEVGTYTDNTFLSNTFPGLIVLKT